jgi:long-chain fatty acid transport protein
MLLKKQVRNLIKEPFVMKKYLSLKFFITGVLFFGFTNISVAGGFQLYEQNAVNMGDFGAGGAAIADDASTSFFNSAGMVRITNPQLVLSGDTITTKMHFTGSNIWNTTAHSPLSTPIPSFTQSGTADGGTFNIVPALHFVSPLSHGWAFGFSLASPFGLATNYNTSSILRYSATESKVAVTDLSPSLAYCIGDGFSIGGGLDVEYMDAMLNSVAGLPGLAQALQTTPTIYDSISNNHADGWGYGWHTGLLYQFSHATRVGLSYRSAVSFNLDGRSKLTGPLASPPTFSSSSVLREEGLDGDVTLPPSTMLSAYHDINCRWALDGTVMYTQWNKFNQVVRLKNVASVGGFPPVTMPITVEIPEHFHNVWRFALGTQFQATRCFLLRAGVGYDQSPVGDTFRNIRLPDNNRIGLSVGAHYQATSILGLDVGYTHLFVKNADVNYTTITGSQISTAIGNFTSNANLFGAQLTLNIA